MPCELRPTGRKVGGGGGSRQRGRGSKRRGGGSKRRGGGGQTKEEGGSKKRSGVRKKTGGVKKKAMPLLSPMTLQVGDKGSLFRAKGMTWLPLNISTFSKYRV